MPACKYRIKPSIYFHFLLHFIFYFFQVCCTHDSTRSDAQTCADTAVNCEFWIPCYIVWWKLADTVGPATFLRLDQEDDFFNIDLDYIRNDFNSANNYLFYAQWFNRFVDDDYYYMDDSVFGDPTRWDQVHY